MATIKMPFNIVDPGFRPRLMVDDATALELSEKAALTFDPDCTLIDVKTFAPGQTYSESPSEVYVVAVAKRQDRVSKDYHNAARKLDKKTRCSSW